MSSYEFENNNDGVLFKVLPDLFPVNYFAIILMLVILTLMLMVPMGSGSFVIMLPFSLLMFYLSSKKKTSGHRFPHEFCINKNGIVKDGITIPADRIHRLIIRNPISKIERPYATGGTAIYGRSLGDIPFNAINIAGDSMKQLGKKMERKELDKIESVSYELHAEAGGKATKIAHGLDEVCANGLLQDAMRALNQR